MPHQKSCGKSTSASRKEHKATAQELPKRERLKGKGEKVVKIDPKSTKNDQNPSTECSCGFWSVFVYFCRFSAVSQALPGFCPECSKIWPKRWRHRKKNYYKRFVNHNKKATKSMSKITCSTKINQNEIYIGSGQARNYSRFELGRCFC